MNALFISDLHLCEEGPATTQAFFAFMRGPACAAEALYVLGDLFEYWIGDDGADGAFELAIADAFAALSDTGVRVHFMPGNRDFLLGPAFAARARMALLPDPSPIESGGRRFLLSHGDALCTDDAAYQAWRTQARDPLWQRQFLARPLPERRAFAEQVRRQSESAKQTKPMAIMDVNPDAVDALLRAHGYPTLIHGHTHRPARHLHRPDGIACERWVLADWHDDAPYLSLEDGELEARRYRPPAAAGN